VVCSPTRPERGGQRSGHRLHGASGRAGVDPREELLCLRVEVGSKIGKLGNVESGKRRKLSRNDNALGKQALRDLEAGDGLRCRRRSSGSCTHLACTDEKRTRSRSYDTSLDTGTRASRRGAVAAACCLGIDLEDNIVIARAVVVSHSVYSVSRRRAASF